MSLTAALPHDLETLADSLSASADELHERIMRGIRQQQRLEGGNGGAAPLTQGAAQALFENEVALRQQANSLYVDAASHSLEGMGVTLPELLRLAAETRATIRRIERVKELAGISADLLAVAAAIAAARPEHLLAPLESLKKQLAARHARESA
ncbi:MULTISPECIES: hypothetical protein [unclassified Duganella]|uniref:hypothetical protein n=1 Tax=unclassified Duganella TaxID=2636909 RepID=UPI0006FCB74B|nr:MULTISPECIES: hypothetical protein [unclassified Duganella]KQV46566.1 hypothetical protein ASD07_13940 [Duganella sp. Root336D2]KRC02359.1 hypothetical protein ASE26_20120 [Duganella sp. Root198D2]